MKISEVGARILMVRALIDYLIFQITLCKEI